MGYSMGNDYLDNKKLTTEELVLLAGRPTICIGCGNALMVPVSEKLVVLCRCGYGWGIDEKGLYMIEREDGQKIWDDQVHDVQN